MFKVDIICDLLVSFEMSGSVQLICSTSISLCGVCRWSTESSDVLTIIGVGCTDNIVVR